MPFLYVYSPSDFVGGLPRESGGAARGSGTFNLTLAPGAQPTLIEVNDNEGTFNEIDYSQDLAGNVNIDGTSYSAGTTVHSAYDLINTSTGHKVTSLHFGGDGYEQGAVHGLVSTEPLSPGTTYTFNYERTSYRQNNAYEDYVACFVAGTQVRAAFGEVSVESLEPGDQVMTVDGAKQTVRLVLKRNLTMSELDAHPNLRPVRITPGAMGQGLPQRDLLVSPQHRMLVSGQTCERVFGEEEALVSARKLTQLPGVYVDIDADEACYIHLVFDQHQIIFAEGAPSESFYFGAQAIGGLSDEAREELLQLFPDLMEPQHDFQSARLVPKGKAQARFVERLRRNAHAPLDTVND